MIPLFRYWDKFLRKYQPVIAIDFGLPGSDAVGFVRVHIPEGGCMGGSCWDEVKPDSLEPAMGDNKDMEGKQIFSGDILEQEIFRPRSGMVKCRSIVSYDEHLAAFLVREIGVGYSILVEQKNRKIIGNIHENPELMEEKQ